MADVEVFLGRRRGEEDVGEEGLVWYLDGGKGNSNGCRMEGRGNSMRRRKQGIAVRDERKSEIDGKTCEFKIRPSHVVSRTNGYLDHISRIIA
ncbi:hypothetical protein HPP92_005228 [Vanilla planifolia]|uniref:Uncharacterized protein n=1 Tax=Vanilla planifolia TaxID=51239 RepID=A0A835RRS6_VANPL|nr:hypothetical protein HPP92_005523 [Vanilla planifolia]KAG0494234.1 hypothetical protein HPP92_005228 [Vanilla planifolia]